MDPNQPDKQATLTIPTITLLKNNKRVLDTFLEVLKICVEIYKGSSTDRPPEVSSEQLHQGHPLWWHIGIQQVGYLLEIEPNICSTFSRPDRSGEWKCMLVRGVKRFREVTTIEDYLAKRNLSHSQPPARILPASRSVNVHADTNIQPQQVMLHPDIQAKCWSFYTQGEYDMAIFQATKMIEIAVRRQGNLPDDAVGADLIAKAFRSDTPLLTYSKVKAEQEGMMSLLRGMILVYKNPHSHRFVGLQDASECLGVLLMCSTLLSLIDKL